MQKLKISSLVLVLFVGTIGLAQAENFKASYAGSVTSTEIDFGGDEETAQEAEGVGIGNRIGKFIFHEVREFTDLPPDDPQNQCPAGEIERKDIHFTIIFTDQNGKNQLFFRLADIQHSFTCLDPKNPPSGGVGRQHNYDIIGGTNLFEKASGQVSTECTGVRIAKAPFKRGPAHGAVACEMVGNIQF